MQDEATNSRKVVRMSESHDAVPGFEDSERLMSTVEFRDVAIRFAVPLIALFLISWLIARGLLSAAGAPSVGLIALAVAVLFMGFIVLLRKRQLAAIWARTSLVLSPQGIVVDDPTSTTSMNWTDIRRAGQVIGDKGYQLNRRTGGSSAQAGIAAGAAVNAATMTASDGLLGIATREWKPDASRLAVATVTQNVLNNGADPLTGEPLTAIIAQQYEVAWRTGRIGAWVTAYRPDLLTEMHT